ncbi:HAD hydrolase family protein [Komagataeibacter rhaeticus]|nr:HAD hydrolase family protein [Komagataeibacter rhaeticus]
MPCLRVTTATGSRSDDAHDRTRFPTGHVRLVVSDIDGTLITPAREITPAAHRAADDLRAAGIRLSLVSSRAPRGMMQYVRALRIETPIAGLNGGLICDPDGYDPRAAVA